jgi:hypothetical protein
MRERPYSILKDLPRKTYLLRLAALPTCQVNTQNLKSLITTIP